ncbi:MAG: FHA domain-containing protein [Kofleriaceae bacterium]
MCGHESPAGSSFCLNCGSSLAPAFVQTAAAPSGLPAAPPVPGMPGMPAVAAMPAAPGMPAVAAMPVMCAACGTENPPGMKFCRNCGTALGSPPPPGAIPMGGSPMGTPPTAAPMAGPALAPTMAAPGGQNPYHQQPPGSAGPVPGALHTPGPAGAPGSSSPASSSGTVTCPRCGAPTPVGFAYCQQCGLHMQALQPTDLGASVRSQGGGRPASNAPALAVVPAAPAPSALSQAGAAWGTAILVNRDGSDGQRFSLTSDFVVIGRTGDVAFADDRFLAREHARIERTATGVTLLPLDTLNGVFRKADAPVELDDGTVILVGREVLRYERVDPEETKVHALVRHGVALFGSPPREPWGRFVQLVPSGGYRDVRHLAGEEVVIGREEGDIVFRDDAFMSRRHAAVTWDGKRAQISDLGSSNGTFVRVVGSTALKHGDHVRMGDQLLRIELR